MTLAVDVLADVKAIQGLDSVDAALRVLQYTTGLRSAVIARVTEHSWTACAVADGIGWGLQPGDALDLAKTY